MTGERGEQYKVAHIPSGKLGHRSGVEVVEGLMTDGVQHCAHLNLGQGMSRHGVDGFRCYVCVSAAASEDSREWRIGFKNPSKVTCLCSECS